MATAVKHTWTDYAILQASSGGKEWKVQRNEEGAFRCSCPSFIFSKVSPKTCKHCRRCEQQLITDGKAVPVVPSEAREWGEATKTLEAMLFKAGLTITGSQKRTMTEVLAARLAVFEPKPTAVSTEVIGVRRITFDD
jgi:hypothetical protein